MTSHTRQSSSQYTPTKNTSTKNSFMLFALCLVVSLGLFGCGSPTVENNDSVLVTYTGRFQNGTVFDTNDITMRDSLPMAADARFTQLPVRIGASQVVPGFENALLGMHEGETKTVRIKAKEAYGGYDPANVAEIPKEVMYELIGNVPRIVPVDMAAYRENGGNATIGRTFESRNFRYNVTSANETHVMLYILDASHDPITIEQLPWSSTLIDVNETTLKYKHLVDNNKTYALSGVPYIASVNATAILLDCALDVGFQTRTSNGLLRITAERNGKLVFDFNHPLAGEDLNFTITIDKIEKKT